MAQVQVMPLSHVLSAKPNDEPARCTERHNRDHWILAELGLVVGMKPHAVIAAPVLVGEDVVERHSGPLGGAREEPSGCRCERPRLERLPRIAIADVAGPGDQARLKDPPPQARSHAAPRVVRCEGPPGRRRPPGAEATPARGRARRRIRATCACRVGRRSDTLGRLHAHHRVMNGCPPLVRFAPLFDHDPRFVRA